ncbi:hypothetical protein D3C76_70480 [compost metagenome]
MFFYVLYGCHFSCYFRAVEVEAQDRRIDAFCVKLLELLPFVVCVVRVQVEEHVVAQRVRWHVVVFRFCQVFVVRVVKFLVVNAFDPGVNHVTQHWIGIQQVQEFHCFLWMLGVRGDRHDRTLNGSVRDDRITSRCGNHRVAIACRPQVISQRLGLRTVHEPLAGSHQVAGGTGGCSFRSYITCLIVLVHLIQSCLHFRRFQDVYDFIIGRIQFHSHRQVLDDVIIRHVRNVVLVHCKRRYAWFVFLDRFQQWLDAFQGTNASDVYVVFVSQRFVKAPYFLLWQFFVGRNAVVMAVDFGTFQEGRVDGVFQILSVFLEQIINLQECTFSSVLYVVETAGGSEDDVHRLTGSNVNLHFLRVIAPIDHFHGDRCVDFLFGVLADFFHNAVYVFLRRPDCVPNQVDRFFRIARCRTVIAFSVLVAAACA